MAKDKVKLLGMGAGATALAMALHRLEKECEDKSYIGGLNEPLPFAIRPTIATIDDEYYPTAKKRRAASDRRKVTPPRSMTPEELAYYKIHKTLKGFNPPR